ncbi:MAG: PIG-L family deacetylase [Nanoarchaeota archaeon]
MKILVIAAHPDDEVLGCGGTIAREKKEGATIQTIILTRGIEARYKKITSEVEKQITQVYENALEANRILGMSDKDITFLDHPNSSLNTIPWIKLRQELSEIVQQYQPDVVYTHHYGDYNPDHRITFEQVVFACRPCKGEHYPKEIYSFEVLSSTEWAYQNKDSFKPISFVDIKNTMQVKKDALAAYKTELRDYPHPRSIRGLEVLAAKRGMEVNLEFAEAFEVIRMVKT